MKNSNFVKFTIDIVMAVVFVLLFNKQVLGGLTFHEIAGLAIAVIFLTHVLLNAGWVKRVTLKIFDKKLPGKTRFGYLLNVLLLITMTFNMVSGIIISRIVFPNINIGNETWFKVTHISVSFFTLVLVAVHVGLHWQWVIQVWKKVFKIKESKLPLGIVAQVAAVLIFAFGGYEMYTTNFFTRVAGVTSVFGASSTQMGEGHAMMEGGMQGQMPSSTQEEGQAATTDGNSQVAANGGTANANTTDGSTQQGFAANGERPNMPEGMEGMRSGREGGSTNVFNVLLTYFSIMAVFIVIVYYLEKFLFRKKRKEKAVAAGV